MSVRIKNIPSKIRREPVRIIIVNFSPVSHTARPVVIKGEIPITLDARDAPAYLTLMKLNSRPIGYDRTAFNNINSKATIEIELT